MQFASQEIAEKALKKHKERIGHRWGWMVGWICHFSYGKQLNPYSLCLESSFPSYASSLASFKCCSPVSFSEASLNHSIYIPLTLLYFSRALVTILHDLLV